ncbi:MAG TPA: cation diffusion facilitator family transporter [Bryobacteraceae bacterium]|nr:cation diffusion facilitator family transporter [Bryobacteraceae bacterium]
MQIGQRVALAGMVVSGALAAIKITAGLMGHSTAVVADGLESTGDVFASGIVLLGLTVAAKPADWDHPYGHGRVETVTGLFVGFMLAMAGLAISANAWHTIRSAMPGRAMHGSAMPPPALFVVWPLIGSAVAKGLLSSVKFHYGKKIRSAALLADAWNDSVDILSALAALAAVSLAIVAPHRFSSADHWGAFAVGLIVVFTGLRVTRDTALQLMDTMPDKESMAHVRNAALTVPGVRGVEKCYARKTGLQYHVDLHLEVDPEITVRQSHEIATEVRIVIKETLPWVADVLVHVEPAP